MTISETNGEITEAVGIFKDRDALNKAVAELESTAFPRQDISVMGQPNEIEEKFGKTAVRPSRLEDNPNAPRSILVRPEERTIALSAFIAASAYTGGVIAAIQMGGETVMGMLVAFFGGAVVAGIIAGLLARMYKKRTDMRFDEQVEKGGLLLWVRTPGPNREKVAKEIMRKYGAQHVHIHDIT